MNFFKRLNNFYKQVKLRKLWRKKNYNNFTTLGKSSNKEFYDFVINGGISVGKNTYGKLNVNFSGADEEKLIIGANCSLSGSCNFLLGGEHDFNSITTYPYMYRIFKKKNDVKSKGPIIVDDEVWIGDGAWITSGVHIGKGAIVATGAVVTKNVPPYSIVGGCPAQIIKYRFSDVVIEKLMKVDLYKKDLTEKHIPFLTMHLNEDNIDLVLKELGVDNFEEN